MAVFEDLLYCHLGPHVDTHLETLGKERSALFTSRLSEVFKWSGFENGHKLLIQEPLLHQKVKSLLIPIAKADYQTCEQHLFSLSNLKLSYQLSDLILVIVVCT
jgi:hypothetical protein